MLIGREMLLMAHVTWEQSVRGRRLVATRASRDEGGVICVCSSEEEVVAKLRCSCALVYFSGVL